jgi:hypothetical protein
MIPFKMKQVSDVNCLIDIRKVNLKRLFKGYAFKSLYLMTTHLTFSHVNERELACSFLTSFHFTATIYAQLTDTYTNNTNPYIL